HGRSHRPITIPYSSPSAFADAIADTMQRRSSAAVAVEFPAPRVGADRIEIETGAPAQQRIDARGIGVADRNVSRPTLCRPARQRLAAGAFECGDYFEHGATATHAQIERDDSGLPREMGERRHVSRGKVGDVDVVAYARAVGGRVIVAEYVDAGPASRGDVGQNWHQVVRGIRRR